VLQHAADSDAYHSKLLLQHAQTMSCLLVHGARLRVLLLLAGKVRATWPHSCNCLADSPVSSSISTNKQPCCLIYSAYPTVLSNRAC
jgi:hypothetical protein